MGAGLQYKLSDNFSVDTEHGYYDLGNAQIYDFGGGTTMHGKLKFSAVTFGVNYKF